MTMVRLLIFLLGVIPLAVNAAGSGHTLPFASVLTGYNGKPLEDPKTGVVTLGSAAVEALIVTLESDKTLPGLEKFKHDELARKIFNDPNVLLQTEEINLIKERIGIAYGQEVVYPAWKLIEGGKQ